MSRSPIEMMVDRACGFDPLKPYPRVTLRCPKCRREQSAATDPTDPPNTAVVLCVCPKCHDGSKVEVDYFDAKGRQIDLEGKPMKNARASTRGDQ